MNARQLTPKGIARQLEQLAKSIRSGRKTVTNMRIERSCNAFGEHLEEVTIEVTR